MTTSLPSTPAAVPAAHKPSRLSRDGFTLIEVMIAMVIFGIGAMSLLACVPLASKKVMKAGAQTRASSIAAQAAEELLTVPYGHSSITPGAHNDPANPRDGIYYTRWVVESDQPIQSCKRITVTVARGDVTAFPVVRLVIVAPQTGG
jgi:prepilin-type N-terminal cleavage/methylation domain-containing protein